MGMVFLFEAEAFANGIKDFKNGLQVSMRAESIDNTQTILNILESVNKNNRS